MPKTPAPAHLATVSEIAAAVGIPQWTIAYLIVRHGIAPAYHLGNSRLFDATACQRIKELASTLKPRGRCDVEAAR